MAPPEKISAQIATAAGNFSPVRLPIREVEPTPPQTVVIPYDFHTRTGPNGERLSNILAREIKETFPSATPLALTHRSTLEDFAKAGYSETACFIPPLEITLETAERLIDEAVTDPTKRKAMRDANGIAEYCHTNLFRRSDKRPYFTGHCTVAATLSLIHAIQSRKQDVVISDQAIAMEYEALVAHDAIEDSPEEFRAPREKLIRRILGDDCAEQILVMTKDDSIVDEVERTRKYVAKLVDSPRGLQRKMFDNQCNNADDLIALLTDPGADFARIRKSLHKSIEEYGPAFHDRWMQTNNPMNKQLYKQWWTVTQLALHALEKREGELHLRAASSGHNGVIPTGQNGSVFVS